MLAVNRIAIVPGSFDPITLGHVDVVQRAAKEYDKVYLAVMINSEKSYMFTLEQRLGTFCLCFPKGLENWSLRSPSLEVVGRGPGTLLNILKCSGQSP